MRSLNENRFRDGDEIDVVVIGTGAGGGPLIARLAAAGLTVIALEAGRDRVPGEYTPDEIGSGDLYWMGERLSGGGTPEAFGPNNSGIGVGGSTLHWGAFTPRPDPREFRLRTESGLGEDWPLSVAELLPYIEEVEARVGISGPNPYPWDPSRRYSFAPVRRNGPADIMVRGCEAVGIRATDAPAAVLTRDWEKDDGTVRHGCVGCGACHQGCRNDAKGTTANSFLPDAVRDGAEIRTGCMANGFERDGAGRITAVLYRRDGVDRRQRCRAVFLCAGAVETPRLLLHSGIGNSSGQVGRNYMAHLATQVWGSFAEPVRMNHGYPSSIITEDMLRPKDADFASGYLVQSLGVMPATWGNTMARGRGLWGPELTRALLGYNHAAGIGINGDCLPSDANRLELSDEVDGSGMAKPRISFSLGENEKRMDKHATALMKRVWDAAGATDIWVGPRTAHTIGTCRMGVDGDRNVVDPWGRSFDVGNLWICDNSVFPSALAANPALTIMALSLRSADAFLRADRS